MSIREKVIEVITPLLENDKFYIHPFKIGSIKVIVLSTTPIKGINIKFRNYHKEE